MERLIDKYLPSDYCDRFSREYKGSVDDLFTMMFEDFPRPVKWLLKMRDILVKPFGLKGGISFRERIIERNEDEIIIGMNDKHLDFWVSLFSPQTAGINAEVCTVVKFHNLLGRVYFAGIWLFHKVLVSSMFRRAAKG